MKRLGLIAGNGKFPILAAESARKNNIEIVAVAFRGETSKILENLVERIYWINVGDLGKLFEIFKKENIKEAIMAGQIRPIHLFKPWVKKDATLKAFLKKVKDNRGDSLLKNVADMLEERQVKLLDSSFLLAENLAKKGVLTKASPSQEDWENIEFGTSIAKELARLGIGQTVVVKNKAILAVEAIEGTDKTIKRGARLGNSKTIVVKVSRPLHDMRFDIPVVGLRTLKVLKKSKVKILAIEAGKTLLLDKQELLKGANNCGISIVAI